MLPSAASTSISLKFSKDCNNQYWVVSQKSGKKTFKTVSNRAQKPKPSLKISLPIIHYLKAMQQYKNTNAGMKTPNPNHTEVPCRPQHSGLLSTKTLPLSHSSLRMFRHPVPTSRGRTTLADKLDKIVRTPEPISINTTPKGDPNMSGNNIKTPLIKEPVKKNIEELKTSENKPITTAEMLYKSVDNSLTTSIKHKLPLILVAPKHCYGNRSSNPVNKENQPSTTNHTPTTVVQATQTENVFIVTEEGYQIIQTIKTSGLTAPDLQNLIDNFKKQRMKNNGNHCDVIDLENTDENRTSEDIMDIVMKHSSNNKNLLKSAAQILKLLSIENRQPSVPAIAPPSERTTSNLDLQPLLVGPVPPAIFEPSPSGRPVPYGDMVNSFMVLVTLQQHGFHFTNNAVEPPSTQRTDPQTTHTSTQTEDENNNSKKRKSHATDENSSELLKMLQQNNFQRPSVVAVQPAQEFVAMPQQQELPVFTPQMQRQLPQTQIQQFVPKQVERPAQLFPLNLPSLMSLQRNPFPIPRNHPQYPFEQNRTSALSTPQVQVQMPSPVEFPSTVQMHHNNPQSQTMPSQLGGLPRLSRVLSTQEANLRTQAVQHQNPDCNCSFPHYFDRHGNVFPQRHQ